jgi:4-hydroxybutyrate CoA-transferase
MDKIDYFVEHSSPLPIFSRGQASEIEQKIGDYVLELVEDGSCVQMGIGGITEAVVARLDCKKELGINSEMFPMGLEDLIAKGIVTNSHKIDHKGESTATFGMGNKEIYDVMTENPAVTLYPTKYLNHPLTNAKNPKVAAINMAIFVDLTGQIASEGIGHRQVSGAGGQLDFAIGAYWSKGGKGMTLITSARSLGNGEMASSIVPELPPGTPVTVPRAYADYVITEYGAAHIRGLSRRERAEALINIAHPDFRADLRKAAQSAFYPD